MVKSPPKKMSGKVSTGEEESADKKEKVFENPNLIDFELKEQTEPAPVSQNKEL